MKNFRTNTSSVHIITIFLALKKVVLVITVTSLVSVATYISLYLPKSCKYHVGSIQEIVRFVDVPQRVVNLRGSYAIFSVSLLLVGCGFSGGSSTTRVCMFTTL